MTRGGADKPAINGRTRLFGIIGDPVNQVQAPALLNPVFEQLGMDAVLVPFHVRPSELTEVIQGLKGLLNLDGLLVTVPHKVAVCRLADRLSRTVAATGSANAIRREPDGSWYAENFDGAGFVAGLNRSIHSPRGRRVAIVGAGGAGSAIAVALLHAGVAELRVFDRDIARLDELGRRVRPAWHGRVTLGREPDLRGIDLVVNATPLGLREDDELPFAPDQLPAGATVADIVMKPRETRLLKTALSLGHPVHHGIHMLSHQIDLYRDFFGIDGRLPQTDAQ